MGKEGFLLVANAIVWLGLCGYLVFMATRQKRLERRLKQLETLKDD
ncbi:MAG: CcmD family protein [Acidobacteriota bacterium]